MAVISETLRSIGSRISEAAHRIRPERPGEVKQTESAEPQPLTWNGTPVEVITYERMDQVPMQLAAIGAFFGGIGPDGIFVEQVEVRNSGKLINICDCRRALGTEVDPAEDKQKFVQELLDRRLGKNTGGVIFSLR